MSSSQHTLHVISELDGYGLNRQLELLARGQLEDGQNVHVVALRGQRRAVDRLRQQGVAVRVLGRRWEYDPFVAVRLAKVLRSGKSKFLHIWGQSASKYVWALSRFAPPLPQLATVPGDRKPLGVDPPSPQTLSRAAFLSELNLPEQATLIAVAGPLVRSRQIDEAIWYFELVRTLDENVRLIIFGDGPDRHRLERFARLTSEPNAIRFLGYRSDFRDLLPCVDLFWHTAAPDNALPQTLLEALAAGVPVVANDGPGSQKILELAGIGSAEACCVVPDKDRAAFARQTFQIIQERTRDERAENDAARTIVERFSVEAMTDAYADLYTQRLGR